jgi:hypothetical protein
MILPFSTQMNGKPTYFVEKIWASLYDLYKEDEKYFMPELYYACIDRGFKNMHPHKPKRHTFREDEKDRWHAGRMIDYFINCRQKDMFRFAPVLPVVSTQKVEIKWFELFDKKMARVFIDNKSFACVKFSDEMIITGDMLQLAQNDGFDTIEDFFAYFNEDFKGKIIHWTDLRY